MSRLLKVALIHNSKPSAKAQHLPADYYSECDSPKTVQAIAKALAASGYTVFPIEANRHLPQRLKENPVDLAFNIAEGFQGEAREARVPALLELLEIPYTGSGVLSLSLALDKARSKQLFRCAGVPTPNFQLFHRADDPLDKKLHFPLIVKPNREGSAKGIWASSVVRHDSEITNGAASSSRSHETALRIQIQRVLELYDQEVLVEEFIDGTELTVGILGPDRLLPVLEIDFSECAPSGEFFYSWRMKEYQGNKEMHLTPRFWCPARLSESVTHAVGAVALKAAKTVGFRDISRVDIRLSSDGIPFVLEVNPLPGLDPKESNFPIMSQAAGISYEALLKQMVQMALERAPKSPSSIPLSKESDFPSPLKAPQRRGLPAAGAKDLGEAPGVPAVARRGIRRGNPKEEDLGR
ncbi:MAG: hypothetical protein HY211_04770 [Candidatus Omnitrophica bacterium]|nr:hypothetical protein [Candidatus Omnitrophota bacterium]